MSADPRPTAAEDAADRIAALLPPKGNPAPALVVIAGACFSTGATLTAWAYGFGALLLLTLTVLAVAGTLARAEYVADQAEQTRLHREASAAVAGAYTAGIARGMGVDL